jgi:hypothetical protein
MGAQFEICWLCGVWAHLEECHRRRAECTLNKCPLREKFPVTPIDPQTQGSLRASVAHLNLSRLDFFLDCHRTISILRR